MRSEAGGRGRGAGADSELTLPRPCWGSLLACLLAHSRLPCPVWKSCHSRPRWVAPDCMTPSGAPSPHPHLTHSLLPGPLQLAVQAFAFSGDFLLPTLTPLSTHSTGGHCWLIGWIAGRLVIPRCLNSHWKAPPPHFPPGQN